MNDVITEQYDTAYEQTCFKCIDDLYHMAYFALADSGEAEKLVTEICVAGVHKYNRFEDDAENRFRLTADLYHRIKRRLWFTTPNTDALPQQLQVLTKQERLIVALRFSSGLAVSESARIIGLTPDEYRRRINEIMRKPLDVQSGAGRN